MTRASPSSLSDTPSSFSPSRGGCSPAAQSTGKISSKAYDYAPRSALLGGGGGVDHRAYQPLTDSQLAGNDYEYRRNFSEPEPYHPPGGYHDRQGLTTSHTVNLGKSQSKRAMYMPTTFWTWSFFLLALLQAIICLGLEAFVFGEFEESLRGEARSSDPPSGALTIPTYLTIFIFGFLYQMILVWDALRLKNTIQVIGLCLYNLGMMIYAAVEIDQVDEAVDSLGGNIEPGTWIYLHPCLIATPCVLALGTILLSFVSWKLYDEFAWTIYKQISANLILKRRYLTYQVSSR